MKPGEEKLVSIVINNYNYANFLEEAIQSSLAQTYKNIEIVLVDDGSTDRSETIAKKYRHQLICVRKENGGQASAINFGFCFCKGEFILFLDADDLLDRDAIRQCMALDSSSTNKISKIQAPLSIRADESTLNGKNVPFQKLPSGSLRSFVLEHGPASYPNPPMSGNLWSKHFLSQVIPIPETHYRTSADAYLFSLSPLFGDFSSLDKPIGKYRLHGRNNYWNREVSYPKLRQQVYQHKQRCLTMERFSRLQKENVSAKKWRMRQRYYLAKVVALWKLRGARTCPISFNLFRDAVMGANISLHKKLLWLAWFVCMAIAPRQHSLKLIQAYLGLQFRVSK